MKIQVCIDNGLPEEKEIHSMPSVGDRFVMGNISYEVLDIYGCIYGYSEAQIQVTPVG